MKADRACPGQPVRDDTNKALLYMTNLVLAGCTAGSVACGLVLEALGANDCYDHLTLPGLPSASIHIAERGAVLCVTQAREPAFRDGLAALAAEAHLDVVLLRVALDHDRLIVTADVALELLPGTPWSMDDLALWRGADGALWLVPPLVGPAVSITADGFWLELLPPYDTFGQRAAGIDRAEREGAFLLSPLEAW